MILPDDLDQITATATKYEQMPRMRISFQGLLGEQCKPWKAAPHIGVTSRKPHARAHWNRDHLAASRAVTIRNNVVASTSEPTRTRRPLAKTMSKVQLGF
jgi:hypothetical protein